MHSHPFSLLRQFPGLAIELYDKGDALDTKNDLPDRFKGRNLAIPRQTHGKRTVVARKPTLMTEEADGIATDVPGLTLAIRMADCQTFAVYAPNHRVVGLLHAGWRGLAAGAIPAFYKALRNEWGINPAETLVAAGPSLCRACSEFTDPASELPGIDPRFFEGRRIDLRGIADDQLDRLGVPQAQRERHPDCTKCNPNRYWSYRGPDREAVRKGWENLITCTLLG